MDANARRQTGPPVNAPSQNPVPDPNAQRRSYGTGASRYWPVPMDTFVPTGRGMVGVAAYRGNYPQATAAFSLAIPRSTMSYQSEYEQVTPQAHNFRARYPSSMYNVSQLRMQHAVHNVSPLPRPYAAPRTMPADVTASSLLSEPANTGTAHVLPAQAVSSGASKVDPPGPADGDAAFDGEHSAASTSKMTQASEAPKEQEHSISTEVAEAYEQYQETIKAIFTNIGNGVLVSASKSLLKVSDWLLSKVKELGLTTDNPQLYHDRMKLWHDFNHAWLALLQKQKDLAVSGTAPQRGQTLMSKETLKKMGSEIVRLCDGIEEYGLVDYEYGVWEERIIGILTECLEFYENTDESGDTSLANPSASR
ncbi:hypothetical protein PGQ11_009409 [Apiospora arundinis]|uniref:Uncharacterized protein n=1 Tax=Apiospora arundinis TaxID=335852 RepID=A0ABR2IHZ6_9PEZI